MKIMLCSPPNWTPTMPYLALPTLIAYLRTHGVSVIQRDLNLEGFDALLTRQFMRESLTRLRDQLTRDQQAASRSRQRTSDTPPADRVERLADLVESRLLETPPIKPFPQFYMSDVFRFFYASHVNEHKLPLSPWLVAEATAA